ncbi:MAG: amidohydrolase family protein, partial [Planctomycetota bacterium]
ATHRLFERALELGCRLRIHTDQFNELGATAMAIDLGARSVDHMEASTTATIERMAAAAGSNTIGVMLPCAGLHVDDRYADGRALVDAGAAVAIATNFNPGSAPCPSMPFTIAMACRKNRLTPAEAITAATWNAACVLDRQSEAGAIAVGRPADLVLLDTTDERMLGFEFATTPPAIVMIGGRLMRDSRRAVMV